VKAKPPIQQWAIEVAMRYASSPVKDITPTAMVIDELVGAIRFGDAQNAWERLRGILDARVAIGDHEECFNALSKAWERKPYSIRIDGQKIHCPRSGTLRRRKIEIICAIDSIQDREGRAPTLEEVTDAMRGSGIDRKKTREAIKALGWLERLSQNG